MSGTRYTVNATLVTCNSGLNDWQKANTLYSMFFQFVGITKPASWNLNITNKFAVMPGVEIVDKLSCFIFMFKKDQVVYKVHNLKFAF